MLLHFRILKYYAWESSYQEIIERYRREEVRVILTKAFIRAASDILYVAGTVSTWPAGSAH